MKITKYSDIPKFTRDGQWQADFSPKDLITEIDRCVSEEGLQLEPDFQRGHVWTLEQQSAFMEYFLRGGKSGRVIYLNKPSWNRSVSVDAYDDFDQLGVLKAKRKGTQIAENLMCILKDFNIGLLVINALNVPINSCAQDSNVFKDVRNRHKAFIKTILSLSINNKNLNIEILDYDSIDKFNSSEFNFFRNILMIRNVCERNI